MSYWFSLVFPWLLVFWGSHALTARLKRAGGKRVRGCFKNRSRRREEAERCAIPSRNPPPHVGGYGAWGISKHALRGGPFFILPPQGASKSTP